MKCLHGGTRYRHITGLSKSITEYKLKAQQLSESRGGRPELPAHKTSKSPYDVCGRKATLDEEEDKKTARTKDKGNGSCSLLVKCANNTFCDRALREVLTEVGCFSRDLVRDTLHFHLPIYYIFICLYTTFYLPIYYIFIRLYTTFLSAVHYISICLYRLHVNLSIYYISTYL